MMRLIIVFLFLCLPSLATIRCVGAAPAGVTCDVTYAPANSSELQSGLGALACGDTLYIQAGVTYVGTFVFHGVDCSTSNPITVTTNKPTFLPGIYTRVTPSDLPNMPNLQYAGLNQLILYSDALYSNTSLGSRSVPKNWYFTGIAFTVGSTAPALTYSQGATMNIAGGGLDCQAGNICYDIIQNASETPDTIWWDRCLFLGPNDNSVNIQSFLHLICSNCGIKNSMIDNVAYRGEESHGLILEPGGNGGFSAINNFISAASIAYFGGGTASEYLGAIITDETVKFNYLNKPYKYWPNNWDGGNGVYCWTPGVGSCYQTANPHGEWFLANAVGGNLSFFCTKNEFEHKELVNGLIEYNVLEHAWQDNGCQGQYFGITETPRTFRDCTGCYGIGTNIGTISTTGTSFSISGTTFANEAATYLGLYHNMFAGQGICSIGSPGVPGQSSPGYIECQTIASFNYATYTGTLVAPFANNLGPNASYYWIIDPYATWRNVTVQNNLFRETIVPFQHLPRDTSNLTSSTNDAGRLVNVTTQNNLVINTLFSANMIHWAEGDGSELPYLNNDPLVGSKNYTFNHNTMIIPGQAYNGIQWVNDDNAYQSEPPSLAPQYQGLNISNNVFPHAIYPVVTNGDCTVGGNNLACMSLTWGTGTQIVANNFAPGSDGYFCYGVPCSGNVFSGTPTYLSGYKTPPTSPLYKAASDGSDIGPNPGMVPMISNIRVTASDNAAVLEFDLSAPIQDARNTQPCAIEVSNTETPTQIAGYPTIYGLPSDLSSYTVTNDLNPVYFKQATATNRTNPLLLPPVVNGGHVSFPIGQAATVTGDDGISHNLALSPATLYQGRAMCYGDTQYFSFTTTPTTSGVTVQPFQFSPASSVATVKVDYGATSALGSSVNGAVATSGPTRLSVPVTAGVPIYTRITYKDSAGNVVYTGAVQLQIP